MAKNLDVNKMVADAKKIAGMPSADPDSTKEHYAGDANTRSWDTNIKDRYDQHLDFDDTLKSIFARAAQHAETTIAALDKSLVGTMDLIAKRAINGADLATMHQWSPVEQGAGNTLTARAVSLDDASLKAIAALVVQAVANATGK